ncbi:hypothetical protein PSHT_04449 [Puccinia striiformis]|uniref:Uncharacterized protein n=1 Tax=Puccinia striiformis TaxID=27350 RepID=A0A2S4WD26_9BASI|nr:hypothetical protein PSHT_04449 [Puccinia striiformis]
MKTKLHTTPLIVVYMMVLMVATGKIIMKKPILKITITTTFSRAMVVVFLINIMIEAGTVILSMEAGTAIVMMEARTAMAMMEAGTKILMMEVGTKILRMEDMVSIMTSLNLTIFFCNHPISLPIPTVFFPLLFLVLQSMYVLRCPQAGLSEPC